jgi:hypothetical protein
MGAGDLDGRRLKPSIKKSRVRWRVQPDAAIGIGKVVLANAMNTATAYMVVTAASNLTEACRRQTLYVTQAGTSASGGPTLEVALNGVITDVDTSGGAAGDPVYLGTAGGFVLTPAGNERLIGKILRSNATTGMIEFNGSLTNGTTDEDFTTGTVIVASGATTGTVTVGTAWNSAIIVGTLRAATTNNVTVRAMAVAAGDVTATLSGDPGAGGAVVQFIAWKGTVGFTDA